MIISTENIMTIAVNLGQVCEDDNGWLDIVVINGEDWHKCRICGKMYKISKRKITPLGGGSD